MTMLDDDRLASLFARAGGGLRGPRRRAPTTSWPGPPGARPTAADGDGRRRPTRRPEVDARHGAGGPSRRAGRARRRRRGAAATACSRWPPASSSLLVLAGAVGALVRSPAHPTVTAALGRTPARQGPDAVAAHDDDHTRGCSARAGAAAGRRADAAPSGVRQSGAQPVRRAPTTPQNAPTLPKRRRGPARQDRADRSLAPDRRPREPGPDGHAADHPRRRLRRLRGQLADAVGRGRQRALGQRHAPGAGGQLRRPCCSRPRRSARRRTSRPRPPTSPASTSTCSRASPRCRPAASST